MNLPETLPIFPLNGIILLPRMQLPLHIFEPRYKNMIDDVLGNHRMIGLIQPRHKKSVYATDEDSMRNENIENVGIAARITGFNEIGFGDNRRYIINVVGCCRFVVAKELPITERGYRSIVPDWEPYALDSIPPPLPRFNKEKILNSIAKHFEKSGIEISTEGLKEIPDYQLIDTFSIACNLQPEDKQRLLEAVDLNDRAGVLAEILEIDFLTSQNKNEAT